MEATAIATQTDEFLAHFGVKGMKWGQRKEVPNGSGDDGGIAGEVVSTPSKRQAKATSFREKAAEGQHQLDDLRSKGMGSDLMKSVYGANSEGLSNFGFYLSYAKTKKKALAQADEELNKKIRYNEKTADAYENGKLTPSQKKAIVGGVLAIGAVVGIGVLVAHGNKRAALDLKNQGRMITAEYGGGKIDYNKFKKNVAGSIHKSWGNSEHIERVGATRLEDLDFHIPKGTEFTRISTKAETAVKSGNYAAFLPEDVTRYRATFVNEKIGQGQLHNIQIQTTGDVRVPSLRKKVDTFKELLDEKDMGGISGRDLLAARNYTDKEFIKTASSQAVAEKYYHTVAGGNFSKDTMSKAFADKIVSKGYHAIVDDMDAGVYGDKPMVLLDSTMFKVASSSPLTQAQIKEARENLTEIIGRKY